LLIDLQEELELFGTSTNLSVFSDGTEDALERSLREGHGNGLLGLNAEVLLHLRYLPVIDTINA
jgi:hypothetical protein